MEIKMENEKKKVFFLKKHIFIYLKFEIIEEESENTKNYVNREQNENNTLKNEEIFDNNINRASENIEHMKNENKRESEGKNQIEKFEIIQKTEKTKEIPEAYSNQLKNKEKVI